jgi:hypothetical protein
MGYPLESLVKKNVFAQKYDEIRSFKWAKNKNFGLSDNNLTAFLLQ